MLCRLAPLFRQYISPLSSLDKWFCVLCNGCLIILSIYFFQPFQVIHFSFHLWQYDSLASSFSSNVLQLFAYKGNSVQLPTDNHTFTTSNLCSIVQCIWDISKKVFFHYSAFSSMFLIAFVSLPYLINTFRPHNVLHHWASLNF